MSLFQELFYENSANEDSYPVSTKIVIWTKAFGTSFWYQSISQNNSDFFQLRSTDHRSKDHRLKKLGVSALSMFEPRTSRFNFYVIETGVH